MLRFYSTVKSRRTVRPGERNGEQALDDDAARPLGEPRTDLGAAHDSNRERDRAVETRASREAPGGKVRHGADRRHVGEHKVRGGGGNMDVRPVHLAAPMPAAGAATDPAVGLARRRNRVRQPAAGNASSATSAGGIRPRSRRVSRLGPRHLD